MFIELRRASDMQNFLVNINDISVIRPNIDLGMGSAIIYCDCSVVEVVEDYSEIKEYLTKVV